MPKKQRHCRINPIARAPILRKGGVHEKSNSAKRQQHKQQLRRLLDRAGAGFSGSADLLKALLFPTQHMLVARQ
ncbi:hypothetical protein [Thiothrix nivea]|uniref:Uncharacterized protein n=1 Tax=Thiothrix nivea (strain ATCC 35100 / DSM 5205 / JP2) TaxID=870187 RepID=A0A656HC42_THINJ|nr:hypothetical protein [Thiothrix nivea]EIJ34721.1 hypothetical protein Thini_2154 [Thiothrix nivea DSM 5205]